MCASASHSNTNVDDDDVNERSLVITLDERSSRVKTRRPLTRKFQSQNNKEKPQPEADRLQPQLKKVQTKKAQTKKPLAKKPLTKTATPAKPKSTKKPGDISWEETSRFHNSNGDKPFVEVSGPARTFTKQMTPLQIFEHFFSQKLIETITAETNRYHQ